MQRLYVTALVIAVAGVLQGCAGQPYVDARREAGKRITVGASNEDVVAICHAGSSAPPAALKLAESECARTGRVPQFVSRTRFSCAVLTPSRSYFRCVAPTPGQSTPG